MKHRRRRTEVARILNAEGAAGPGGRAWTQSSVARTLERRTYTGVLEDGRFQGTLGSGRAVRLRGPWTAVAGAVEPIVTQAAYRRAGALQLERRQRSRKWTDESLIEGLIALRSRVGSVSAAAIDADTALPHHSVYTQHFGGLANAYILADLPPPRFGKATEVMKALRQRRADLSGELALLLHSRGHDLDLSRGTVTVDSWLRLRFCPAVPYTHPGRGLSWNVRPLVGAYRYLVGVRLTELNGDAIDYALLDHLPSRSHFRIGPKSARWRASPRADTMDGLASLLELRL